MGQPIVVKEKPSVGHPGVVRFETNRALTGMGHERYDSRADAAGHRPPDELARRLFDHGGVERIQINANVVTVDLERGATTDGMADIVGGLYTYYPEAPAADAETGTEAAPADAPGEDGEAEPPAPIGRSWVDQAPPTPPAPFEHRLPTSMATAALVFAILSIFVSGVFAIVAVVLATVSRGRIRRDEAAGAGRAKAALWIGWIVIVIDLLVLVAVGTR